MAQKLSRWIWLWDTRLRQLEEHCRGCDVSFDNCRSLDCPKMYLRTEARKDAEQIQVAYKILAEF